MLIGNSMNTYYAISAGYHIVALTVMGMILAAFTK